MRGLDGFSLWCDYIERDFLDGEFKALIESGVINGATSNPAIFKEAFLHSPAYRSDIERLKGEDPKEIYEKLATSDIQKAASLLYPLYEKGDDGFISIEVDPTLCDDAAATVEEAERLYKEIGQENVMIKIPATEAGYEAMERLFAKGIHINATLIFSPKQTQKCIDAFQKGLEAFHANSNGKKMPSAVISIFVSRIDRALNPTLKALNFPLNVLGIINASRCYKMIEVCGVENIRALFASTGVKGDDLPQAYYITELLYKNAINTAPLKTIKAFLESDSKDFKTPPSDSEIDHFFTKLKEANVDIEANYKKLLEDGLKAFKEAFGEILKALEKG